MILFFSKLISIRWQCIGLVLYTFSVYHVGLLALEPFDRNEIGQFHFGDWLCSFHAKQQPGEHTQAKLPLFSLGYASDLMAEPWIYAMNVSWCDRRPKNRSGLFFVCWQLLFRSNAFDLSIIVGYYNLSWLLALCSTALSLTGSLACFSLSLFLFRAISFQTLRTGLFCFTRVILELGNEYAIYVIAMNGQMLLNWKLKRKRAWTITTYDESKGRSIHEHMNAEARPFRSRIKFFDFNLVFPSLNSFQWYAFFWFSFASFW